MTTNELFAKLHEAAANPKAQMDKYLAQGKKIVLCAPVYTPDELIHSMGFVPMGAWGADTELRRAKEYCPAFLCSIVQSALELGINGAYDGASAIVIPSLCDTLKTMGENWKYAVPSIPFIPMTYPQNRKPAYGVAFTKAGYERVIRDLEKLGGKFDDAKLAQSNALYNRHNAAMRKLDEVLAKHPEVTAQQRSDAFKSAFFMTKEEHTALIEELNAALEAQTPAAEKTPILLSGILTDAPGFNAIRTIWTCTSWRTTWPPSPVSTAPTSPPVTTLSPPWPRSSPIWTTAPCSTTPPSPASSGSWTPPRPAMPRACWWLSPSSATPRNSTT